RRHRGADRIREGKRDRSCEPRRGSDAVRRGRRRDHPLGGGDSRTRGRVAVVHLQLHEWGDPSAPPVVCVHGVNAHGRRFRKLAEERLADRFHVLAPDLRGHAGSDWEPPWTIATHAHDVLETLDANGVRRATWVGHSYGGRLLLELAALVPERVERAALLDPAIQLL